MNPDLPAPTFNCSFCDRAFTTKCGLGVHTRAAHPEDFHAINQPAHTKPRWKEAEAYLLASFEASILRLHPRNRIINQLLLEKLPGRTLEAIKGQRGKAAHKELDLS